MNHLACVLGSRGDCWGFRGQSRASLQKDQSAAYREFTDRASAVDFASEADPGAGGLLMMLTSIFRVFASLEKTKSNNVSSLSRDAWFVPASDELLY